MSKKVPVYTLRSRCTIHKLDMARSFVMANNEDPAEAFKQLEKWVRQRFPIDHNCHHRIRNTRITEQDVQYNIKTKKVVVV